MSDHGNRRFLMSQVFSRHTESRFGVLCPSICLLCFLANFPIKKFIAFKLPSRVRVSGVGSSCSCSGLLRPQPAAQLIAPRRGSRTLQVASLVVEASQTSQTSWRAAPDEFCPPSYIVTKAMVHRKLPRFKRAISLISAGGHWPGSARKGERLVIGCKHHAWRI